MEWLLNMIGKKFEQVATKSPSSIFKNIHEWTLNKNKFVVKSPDTPIKQLENKHEAFVSLNCTNELTKYIPNFMYVFGIYEDSKLIMEKNKWNYLKTIH